MNAATVLVFVFLIAGLFAAAFLLTNAELDDRLSRARDARADRRAIEAERRKAAALRSTFPRVMR